MSVETVSRVGAHLIVIVLAIFVGFVTGGTIFP